MIVQLHLKEILSAMDADGDHERLLACRMRLHFQRTGVRLAETELSPAPVAIAN